MRPACEADVSRRGRFGSLGNVERRCPSWRLARFPGLSCSCASFETRRGFHGPDLSFQPRRTDVKCARFAPSMLCVAMLAGGVSGMQMVGQLPSNATLYASGLEGPRGLVFGSDGSLYVAEAGLGGSTSTVGSCVQVVPPIGPYTGG